MTHHRHLQLRYRVSHKRLFFMSDSAQMGPDVQRRLADVEKVLLPLGFRFVADIVCTPMNTMLTRGYAHENGMVWAAMLISLYAQGTFEFISYFEQDASLTTTTNQMARDELYRNAYKARRPEGAVLDL